MKKNNSFFLFHLNLAFSSIEDSLHEEVINKCYFPLLEVFSNNSSPHAFIPRVGIAVALLQTVGARATVGLRRIVVEPRDENAREDLQARVRHGHLTLAMCRLPNGAREGANVHKLAMRVETRPQTHLREFCKARAREQQRRMQRCRPIVAGLPMCTYLVQCSSSVPTQSALRPARQFQLICLGGGPLHGRARAAQPCAAVIGLRAAESDGNA